MLTMGSIHHILWPDNWTAVTEDGSLSAQFEHTLLITEDGSSSNHGYTAEHGEEMREESG